MQDLAGVPIVESPESYLVLLQSFKLRESQVLGFTRTVCAFSLVEMRSRHSLVNSPMLVLRGRCLVQHVVRDRKAYLEYCVAY